MFKKKFCDFLLIFDQFFMRTFNDSLHWTLNFRGSFDDLSFKVTGDVIVMKGCI